MDRVGCPREHCISCIKSWEEPWVVLDPQTTDDLKQRQKEWTRQGQCSKDRNFWGSKKGWSPISINGKETDFVRKTPTVEDKETDFVRKTLTVKE